MTGPDTPDPGRGDDDPEQQRTPTGLEIPVPGRDETLAAFRKVTKRKSNDGADSDLNGGGAEDQG
jgi:hypothetical protein